VYEGFKSLTGFQHTHLREQEIYSKLSPSFTPEIFGLYTNHETNVYIILMEYLHDVELLNSVMAVEKWNNEHIQTALTQMARWHSSMLDTSANLDINLWDDAPSLQYMTRLLPLWQALLNNAAEKCPELYHASRVHTMQAAINNIPGHWQQLQRLSKTLVHNDLNPRNSCFKTGNGQLQFCLYDWEFYFDDENLSKGRDPKLLKYATETGGETFYNRLMQQLSSALVSANFYFRFFFFGPQYLPENILPPCYRKENYNYLKKQLSKLQVITGEAIDYLLSSGGAIVNKASLSNIFEYTSRQEFENVCHALSENSHRHLRIVFWNLLNGQGENMNNDESIFTVEKGKPSEQSCFYFKDVQLLQYAPVTSPKLTISL
jgi:hypothetical protein